MTVDQEKPTWKFIEADALHLPFEDKSFDLVLGSPPYCDARTYGINAQRGCQEWIDWMLKATAEAVRVSRGLVIWVVSGVTRDWCYWPAPEGLLYEWQKSGGRCWRPAYWSRVGIPGSGGKQWLRSDVEYCLAFTGCRKAIPWSDNTVNGHPPKWAPGGAMSHRLTSGARVNQWGHPIDSGATSGSIDDVTCGGTRPSHVQVGGAVSNRHADGRARNKRAGSRLTRTKEEKLALGAKRHSKRDASPQVDGNALREQVYLPPVLANPGTCITGINVGGGIMGSKLCHENEAPFPEALAKWFIRGWCPPGGTVLDPFSGSGTTVSAAVQLGRNGVGSDIRSSQIDLGNRRMEELLAKEDV